MLVWCALKSHIVHSLILNTFLCHALWQLLLHKYTLKRKPGKKPRQQERRRCARSWTRGRSSCRGRGSRSSPGERRWRPGKEFELYYLQYSRAKGSEFQGYCNFWQFSSPGPKLCFSSEQWNPQCHREQRFCLRSRPSSPLESKKPRGASENKVPRKAPRNSKHFNKFNLTWYFSPSALLVTGIKIPSMSAYRAGVWIGKRNHLSSGFLGQSGLFHER